MNQTRRAVSLEQTQFAVPLDDGSTWTGTEAELRSEHPTWLKYARPVQPTRITREDYDVEQDGDYDDSYPGRLPTSARRYAPLQGQKVRYEFRPDTPIQRRRSTQTQTGTEARQTEDVPQATARRHGLFRSHPLLWLGLGMILMLGAWTGLQWVGAWWQLHNDDVTYGRPRTAQYDVVVGHNDSPTNPTHIIAMNLNARVVIIEIPGGDIAKTKIYTSVPLLGQNADLIPVTLTFKDINGDGKLDMLVNVQGDQLIFLNENGQFVPQPTH